MSRLTYLGDKVPTKVWISASLEWLYILTTYSIGWASTYIMGIGVALTSKKMDTHPQGKPITSKRSEKYSSMSSPEWEYWNSPYKLFSWWNNYEDGTLGEPSGKHSARVGGKEKSKWNQYLWTIRNPFNWAKRTNSKYHCLVDNCTIEYYGQYELSDKEVDKQGWQLVIATDKYSGRKYHSYRSVKVTEDMQVRHIRIGMKISPAHAMSVQDEDDKDKAFTLRLPFKTTID